jgi:serine/threonine-protein kinase
MQQVDLGDTLPSTTIRPTGPESQDLERMLAVLRTIGGDSQLQPGAVIGEGGMGIVREAIQTALGRTVAIKTLKPGRRDAIAARDLLREAWITGSLEHPNVVPVHQLGVDADGAPMLVLKRVEGVEWSKLIRDEAEVRRRFGVTDLLAWNVGILMHVLNAVRFAHSRGIIHRDLKPSNVMIGEFGEVYLLDWGIAVSLRPDTTGRLPLASDVKELAGTPAYIAPEMLSPGEGAPLSERTDVYLAGAVLFEIVAGRPPHNGTSALAVLTSVLSAKPELPADAPAELAAICARALAAEPTQRFESAEAIRLALQSYLEHRGSDTILAGARARLEELIKTLASTDRDREAIYRLFGAARFGFHEALAAWHENAEARKGLERATVALAEYELALGNAQAAVTLLTDLDDAPPLLDTAREAAQSQQSRRASLEQLSFSHDLAVGRRSRAIVGLTLGVMFTLAPLFVQWISIFNTRISHAGWSIFGILVLGTWSYAWRDRLTTTLVNRRMIGGALILMSSQFLLVMLSYLLGLSMAVLHTLMLFLYTVILAMLAITVDKVLAASAISFAASAVLAARYPSIRLYVMAVADGLFAINVFYGWHLEATDVAKTGHLEATDVAKTGHLEATDVAKTE